MSTKRASPPSAAADVQRAAETVYKHALTAQEKLEEAADALRDLRDLLRDLPRLHAPVMMEVDGILDDLKPDGDVLAPVRSNVTDLRNLVDLVKLASTDRGDG